MSLESGDVYVEEVECAICEQPTVRVGKHSVDEKRLSLDPTRSRKEPAVCGFCLVEMPTSAVELMKQSVVRRDLGEEPLREEPRGSFEDRPR